MNHSGLRLFRERNSRNWETRISALSPSSTRMRASRDASTSLLTTRSVASTPNSPRPRNWASKLDPIQTTPASLKYSSEVRMAGWVGIRMMRRVVRIVLWVVAVPLVMTASLKLKILDVFADYAARCIECQGLRRVQFDIQIFYICGIEVCLDRIGVIRPTLHIDILDSFIGRHPFTSTLVPKVEASQDNNRKDNYRADDWTAWTSSALSCPRINTVLFSFHISD